MRRTRKTRRIKLRQMGKVILTRQPPSKMGNWKLRKVTRKVTASRLSVLSLMISLTLLIACTDLLPSYEAQLIAHHHLPGASIMTHAWIRTVLRFP
ncbi:hypothetical protein BDW59DRAFT_151572 [Aspergillus cavernicola]|uniref:Uncharacterized protein n=1 Tax=Aspergillus cavernicola TaxID=176166 RepID=A0ABR4HUV7_9EURO